jgi:2-dehydro-3-deoxygluconokinase
LDIDGYRHMTEDMAKKFGLKKIAITLRESVSASENVWSACLFDGKNFHQGKKHRIHIVDRVGTGDAFSAGLIYGLLTGKTDKDAMEFGVAASCLKHTMPGDFSFLSVREAEALAAGDASGRAQR